MGDRILETLKELDKTFQETLELKDNFHRVVGHGSTTKPCYENATEQIASEEQTVTKDSNVENREDDERKDVVVGNGKIEEFLGISGESHGLNQLVACLTKIQETQNNVLMAFRADIEELTITNLILKQQNQALVNENTELIAKVELIMAEFRDIRENIRSSNNEYRGTMKSKQESHKSPSDFHSYTSPTSNNTILFPASDDYEEKQSTGGNILLCTNSTEELAQQIMDKDERQHNTSYLQRFSDELYNRIPQSPKFTSHTNEFNRGIGDNKSKARNTTNRSRLGRFFKVFQRRQRTYTISQFPQDRTFCDDTVYQKKNLTVINY